MKNTTATTNRSVRFASCRLQNVKGSQKWAPKTNNIALIPFVQFVSFRCVAVDVCVCACFPIFSLFPMLFFTFYYYLQFISFFHSFSIFHFVESGHNEIFPTLHVWIVCCVCSYMCMLCVCFGVTHFSYFLCFLYSLYTTVTFMVEP